MINTSFLNLLKYLSKKPYCGIYVRSPVFIFISKKPIQFLELLKELKFISLSFRVLFIGFDNFHFDFTQ
jgi:hypothetical protein